ncbi:DedA family protein [Angustibacter aerolatus]|uniref:VTT domain-containing protein n=1 Tax=Angustibacter aerolatus TaxID=1162965 RepID=A0ABQ6JH66_9ACTN|nr:DedA family protein [Angustibacter aerolatus]GMA86570.1 hypothetical protein GCM10025868_18200 [Angustibacter aerolatus]
MTQVLEPLLQAPTWTVLLVVGLIVFAEDALFVGFVLPGETAAILGGVAARLGHVPLPAVLVTVVAAAIVGDSVGYEVGKRYGPRLLAHRRLEARRERLDAAQALLARRGGAAVFLGRWTAFFRAVMPALAGAVGLRYRRFLAFNAAGGLAWGVVVVVAGYLAGASYQRVEHLVGRGGGIAFVAIVLVAVVVWRVRERTRHTTPS